MAMSQNQGTARISPRLFHFLGSTTVMYACLEQWWMGRGNDQVCLSPTKNIPINTVGSKSSFIRILYQRTY